MRNEQLIFFLGVPGSNWSRLAHLLSHSPILKLNTSDHSPSREYFYTGEDPNDKESYREHRITKALHHGVYFDPGMEFGDGLDNPRKHYSANSFKQEIYDAWSEHDDDRNYLIKSHSLSCNIDWIVDTFPGARIVMILSPKNRAIDRWKKVGGFKITYPNYQWFEGRMESLIDQQNACLRDFVEVNDTPVVAINNWFAVNKLGLNIDDPEVKFHFDLWKGFRIEQPENQKHFNTHNLLSLYNFNDIIPL